MTLPVHPPVCAATRFCPGPHQLPGKQLSLEHLAVLGRDPSDHHVAAPPLEHCPELARGLLGRIFMGIAVQSNIQYQINVMKCCRNKYGEYFVREVVEDYLQYPDTETTPHL